MKGYHKLEILTTGKRVYVEVHVLLDNSLSFEETHGISTSIENELKSVIPNGRVTIHTEPVGGSHEMSGN